jgi:uncharacterized membrane protein YvbJ
MIKSIFLVFGLLIFCTTSYSDIGQIQSIYHAHVKNNTQVPRKRWSKRKIIGVTFGILGICIVVGVVAFCTLFFGFMIPALVAHIAH